MGLFFNRQDPKTELEGLERAQAILNDRYEKKMIPLEVYQKQCMEFQKRREKYEKKIKDKNND